MRNNCIFIILLISIIVFISCNKSTANKETRIYNGIDPQILNIVDSICPTFEELPFITVWFSSCNESSNVIRFQNTIGVPPPSLPPPAPQKEILISESDIFIGYKKYNDVYLVFLNFDINNKLLNNFVEIDSLSFDEEPFMLFNVYEFEPWNGVRKCSPIEKKYLIDMNDSLTFYNGKCLFDID